jgi:hypothetical protein
VSTHDKLLDEGPRMAPEPETAEEHSRRRGMGTVAGGIVGGGAVLAKLGVAGKLFFWFFAWHGAFDLWRLGGWVAVAVLAAGVAVALVWRARSTA